MLKPTASGIRASIAASAVNNTGIIRVLPACTTASLVFTPRERSSSVNSITYRIELQNKYEQNDHQRNNECIAKETECFFDLFTGSCLLNCYIIGFCNEVINMCLDRCINVIDPVLIICQ